MSVMRKYFRDNWYIALIILAVSITVCLLAAAVWGKQSTIPGGVMISGWDVGGMPIKEFQKEWQVKLNHLYHMPVTLRTDDARYQAASYTLLELGMKTNAAEIEQKLKLMFNGPLKARIKHRWKLRNERFELRAAFPSKELSNRIDEQWGDLQNEQPINAVRKITADDKIKYSPGNSAHRVDEGELRQRLERLFPSSWWSSDFPPPLIVTLPIVELKPEITLESLKAEGIERKIAQFTTSYSASGEGRKYNIQSTAQIIHDQLLKPGEIFDYAEIVRAAKTKFGYKQAPVIFNGNFVPGVGGGICQVSTTLYNAVLRGGLEIVERRNHSVPIKYVPLGQDATFSEGYINFRFRNDSGAHLLIRATSTSHSITVKLFGTLPKDITYDIRSKITKKLQPPIKYVKNPALAPGQQQVIRQGRVGYIVETYRYKKRNGEVVEEKLISRDTYRPQPMVIATNRVKIGVSHHDAPPSDPRQPLLEDGIDGPSWD